MKELTPTAIFYFSILVIAVLFFFLVTRPAQIRKECHNSVINEGNALTSEAERNLLNIVEINEIEREKYEHWYQECLNEYGLAQ